MKAFHDIRAQMRDAVALLNDVQPAASGEPMQRISGMAPDDIEPQPWMKEAFEELVQASETGQPFLLMPCTVNGEPTAAIVYAQRLDDQNRVHVTPLFVAMTPGMVLIDQKGRRAGAHEEG